MAGPRVLGCGGVGVGETPRGFGSGSCPSRRGSWKTSGEDGSPPLCSLPPAGRGSAPGWGGGGPDACDWPRPHLGRPAPPPPSCWEQLLLCRRGAGTGAGAGLGTAGGRLALGVACPNPSKSQGLGAASAGTRGAGSAPEQGAASLSKTATRALCARPRRQGRRPGQTSWGAGGLGRFRWKASSPPWAPGPSSSADDTRNWMLWGLEGNKEGPQLPLTQRASAGDNQRDSTRRKKKLWPSAVPGEPLAFIAHRPAKLSNGRHLSVRHRLQRTIN